MKKICSVLHMNTRIWIWTIAGVLDCTRSEEFIGFTLMTCAFYFLSKRLFELETWNSDQIIKMQTKIFFS